ncbi:G-type lectin S-receptor-like serine/threonine-protein kinase [Heracleum sosnowskyi]|uniref:non-specific serine/threonine protein kinase n=1 Tax=Heracleum sosnowskyi TaxID=360622 RepID=A0AAD8HK93_9APIA|nr:G-type lectin S-receptor-like serine/threonine-protein kinase [Heracleum sosnowskyi]KAK1368290.1 G-type lectin S-receptor-like serine/threonine-protein kinase [Heracleum sosnowskyi]
MKPGGKGIPLGVLISLLCLVLLLLSGFIRGRWEKIKRVTLIFRNDEHELRELLEMNGYTDSNSELGDHGTNDLTFFSYKSIAAATNNFSTDNKLGEGGFGPVFKARFSGGQEIAVKQLARKSTQGMVEFKNEVFLIAKLQHTNLVRLLGCCIHKEHKLLIYEYMPNKSLDSFLFDETKRGRLSWEIRFSIIAGISQGLLYLHKIFNQNVVEANTNRVVGTYGYMAPEYAMEGVYSVKSDVYSFGVLILEILSGRKNNSFYHAEVPFNLVSLAWEFWNRDSALELMDPLISDSCIEHQFLRCVHIGLLCVEDRALDRPTMFDVRHYNYIIKL